MFYGKVCAQVVCVCVYPAIYMQEISYSLDERWNSSERERMRQAMLH